MIDRRLIELVSEPDRRNALVLLNERSAGVGEVARALGIEPAEAGRLLDRMEEAGLIEVVGEDRGKGAAEVRYRALVHMLLDDEEWATLDSTEQQRMTKWIMGMIESDVRDALEQGTIAARQDSHMSRTVPVVDEQGWSELRRIFEDTLEAIFSVEAGSAERLAETRQTGIPVLTALLCCELPFPPSGPAG